MPFCLGEVLHGRLGSYTLFKKIQDTVWLARNQSHELAVIKSVIGHPRVGNERDVLQRFQSRSPCIRPLVDEIQDPLKPTTIVLKHLDSDLLEASVRKPLNRQEIKYASRRILEALNVLHEDGYVHTDVKPSNVFVNLREGHNEIRFSDVQLGDFGGSYRNTYIPRPSIHSITHILKARDSEWARSYLVIWCGRYKLDIRR
ncbi:hypothetical protein Hte_009119 [Hypoxylon texense]